MSNGKYKMSDDQVDAAVELAVERGDKMIYLMEQNQKLRNQLDDLIRANDIYSTCVISRSTDLQYAACTKDWTDRTRKAREFLLLGKEE